jgi:hypothetical protein
MRSTLFLRIAAVLTFFRAVYTPSAVCLAMWRQGPPLPPYRR